ncbi:MAG: hypothetical protein RLN88_08685 [Ekhidna sp.]|uniref:hypothetical protein n=1 Tax=Ekhidna sp. TaxID=2608089 RepID=UPI0032EB2A43
MIHWFLHIVSISILAYLGFRFIKAELPTWVYWLALALKLCAGIVLGLIFFEYYGSGDTIAFFESALSFQSDNLDGQPRTQFFIHFIRPIVWVSGGSYWITSLYLSLISFIGTWYSVTILSRLYPEVKAVIVFCFLFIPSVVFWSSGLIKDSLAFAAVAIAVAMIIKLYRSSRSTPLEIILLLASSVILLKIKHYLFITFLLFAGILISIQIFRKLGKKWSILLSLAILSSVLIATQFVHPYLEIDRIPWTLYENNQAILKKSDPEDRIDLEMKGDQWKDIFTNLPKALQAGLLRPSVLDKTPIWGWIHRIENLALTTLMIMSLILIIKQKPVLDWPLILAAGFCIFLLAIMLPLSTPNFGTLVRYKNAYMPYLLMISSILPYHYFTSQTEE